MPPYIAEPSLHNMTLHSDSCHLPWQSWLMPWSSFKRYSSGVCPCHLVDCDCCCSSVRAADQYLESSRIYLMVMISPKMGDTHTISHIIYIYIDITISVKRVHKTKMGLSETWLAPKVLWFLITFPMKLTGPDDLENLARCYGYGSSRLPQYLDS